MRTKDKDEPIISVMGAGYVGLTTAVLFANNGYRTYIVDIDKSKIRKIAAGRSPFFEPNLNDLLKAALKQDMLIPQISPEAINHSQIVLSCVNTPDKADGEINLEYVFAAAEAVAKHAKNGIILVQKSTVPVGTGRELIEHVKKISPKLRFSYVSNPEFLREGTAIADTLYPDRIVVGGDDRRMLARVARLYKQVEHLAAKVDPVFQKEYQPPERKNGKMVFTTLESAELIKVTANAFLALKISFANSIAKLADKAGADVVGVMDGVGLDRRIGRAFLSAGRGYGGGCFPKDVGGLIAAAAKHNVDLEIMQAAVHTNSSMPEYIVAKAASQAGSYKDKKTAVLGLSFKPGTSDTRRSPAVEIANLLIKHGASVTAYDPEAIFDNGDLNPKVTRKSSLDDTVRAADITFIATDWPEFIAHQPAKLAKLMRGKIIVDCMNALNREEIMNAGLTYIGVGR